jgi:hypothetical protein
MINAQTRVKSKKIVVISRITAQNGFMMSQKSLINILPLKINRLSDEK